MRQARLSRDFYIPSEKYRTGDFEKHTDVETGAVWYTWSREREIFGHGLVRHFNLIAFSGKRQTPDKNYFYDTPEQRDKRVIAWLDGIRSHAAFKKEQHDKRKGYSHTLKVDDILYASWGYGQTNIDFYQVVEVVSGKTVRIRKIGGRITENGMDRGKVVADKDAFISGAPVLTKRVTDGNSVKVASYAYASPWDGSELYWSSYH